MKVHHAITSESLWPRVAGLPLVIEACEYERLHAILAHEFERVRLLKGMEALRSACNLPLAAAGREELRR